MGVKASLEVIRDANEGNVLRILVDDVINCLPSDFEMNSDQMRVISEFLGGFLELPNYSLSRAAFQVERATRVMQITNFITLNGIRLDQEV